MTKSMSDVVLLVKSCAKSELIGYESWEISKIEEIYDISITHDIEEFFIKMGRSASNIIHENFVLLYKKLNFGTHLDMQIGFREYLQEAGKNCILESKPLLISIDFEIFHLFLKTAEKGDHFVYEFNEETDEVRNTNELFIMYLYRNALDGERKRYKDIFVGNLLEL